MSDSSPFVDEIAFVARLLARPVHIVRNYNLAKLRPDLIAGLTVAVAMLPQAMSYALIAGLSVRMGL